MSSTDFTINVLTALNKQLSKRQLKNDLKSMDNSMYVKVIAKLAITLSQRQLKKDLKQLNDLYVQIGANVKVDKNTKTQLQNRIQELQKAISELEVNLKVSKVKAVGEVDSVRKEIQAKASKVPVDFNIEIKRSKVIADIEYLGKRFSKLFTNVAAEQKYENILTSAYSISDENQLRSVRNQIAEFTSELKANGLASQSLGDKWRGLVEKSKNLFSATGIVTTVFTQVKQAVSTFLQLDTAMTNLYKVTDDITSRDQFSGLLTKWNKLAQNLAVTTESLINSTAEWSKIGFNLDLSEQLAQITAIFEKTAEISTEKASSTLISVAQAFTEIGDLGENDYVARVEAIGNRINAVGNQYSVSSEGIADGLQNASAALKAAGNDLDETIALITAANKIFQSPSEVSNMLKVVSMRLRGQVDALEEMGEDATGVSTDITKIQQQIYELTGNKVNIFEDEDTLKSTYQLILKIGEVFDSLNDRSQADLLDVMFGKQRSSAGASLLLNYEELEKIKNDSMNSANSMAEEYSKYMESAEAHITIFKEKLVETYSTFINGDLIKYAADAGSGILDLVNATDLLKHGILAVLALKIGQGVTAIGTAIATTSKQMSMLGSSLQQVKSLPLEDDVLREKRLKEIGEATQNLTEKNLKLLLSQKRLEDNDKIMILKRHNLTNEEAKAKLQKMGLTTATNSQSAANVQEAATTNILKGAMGSLKASIIGVGTSIKVAFLSNPIGFILTGITTIISVATTAISNHNQKLEEMRQKAKEAADKANTLGDEIAELANKYISLSEAVKTDESVKEDLISTQTELLKKLGLEGEGIDELIAKYGSLSNAIRQASIESLKNSQIDLIAGVNAARENLLDVAKDNFWGTKNIISATGKDAVKAFEELEKAGIIPSGSHSSVAGAFALYGDETTVEGALENFKKLEDAINALRDSEAFTVDELTNNSLFQAIYDRYNEMKTGVEEYKSAIGDLNENLSQQTMLTALQGREIPKTEEAFEAFKQELIDTAVASEQFIGNEQEIADAINAYLASVPEFEGYYSIPLENELNKVDELLDQKDFSKTFSQAWSDLFTSEEESVKKLGETLLGLAEKGQLTVEAFNLADSTDYFKNLGISAEEAVSKINQLVDKASQLSSMSNQISKISDALGSKRDDGFVSADTLSGFDAEIRGLDSWDHFQEVLGNVNSSYQKCQEAANALASELVSSNDFLAQLTEQNKEYYATQLKAMGVENYEELLTYAQELDTAKKALSLASFDLAAATAQEIQALIDEGAYSESAQQQIWNLVWAKQTVEETNLNTADDCQRLLNLAKNAGVTGQSIELLTELIRIYNNLENGVYGTNKDVLDEVKTRAEAIKQNIINLLSDNANETAVLKPKLKLSPSTRAAAKDAGKETGKSYLDGLKEELSKMGSIISYVSKILGKKITSYGEQKDDAVKGLEAQKDAAKEALEAQKNAAGEAAEAQKDAAQAQIDAKQAEIDKIKEAAEARKNEISLQKAQYDLARMQNQRATLIYSEDKGMHYVADTKGIRDAKDNVADAMESIRISGIEKEISGLEKTIDAINQQAEASGNYYDSLMEASDAYYDRLIENTEAYWESLIKGLEDYQTRWEELADIEEEAKMNAALKELGITTEEILNMSERDFEIVRQKYLGILTEIYAGDEGVLAALQKAAGISAESIQPLLIEELQRTLEKTDEYSNSVESAKIKSSEMAVEFDNVSTSANSVGLSAEYAATGIDILNESLSNVPSTEGIDAVTDAIGRIIGVADSVCESVNKATMELNLFQLAKGTLESGANVAVNIAQGASGVAKSIFTGKAYAFGTGISGLKHDEKNALRSEYGQTELTAYPDGTTELTTSPVMSDLPKGTIVYNEEQTKRIISGKTSYAPYTKTGNAFAGGTDSGKTVIINGREICPLQPGDKMYDLVQKFNVYFDRIDRNIEKLAPNSTYEQNRQMNAAVNRISNVSNIVNNNRNVQPVVQNITLNCPNVTNNSGVEYLKRELNGLSLRAYQEPLKDY